MEEFSEDIIIIYSLAFVGIMFLTLILLIISMISNARRHSKIHGWTIYTQNRCDEIKDLCQDVKSNNNRKLDDIIKLLYAQSSKMDNNHKVIISHLSNLSNENSLINGHLKNLETLLVNFNTKLNSISNEFKQDLVTSLEKVYLANDNLLNKNIQELLSNDTLLKQKSDTINNNFTKYSSELQQKLDYLQKEQKENWNQLKYLQSFKDEVVENTIVCEQILKTISDIEKQEQILNGMIKQHTAIADYSKEIFETQESVVKLLEALMLDTLTKEIDNVKK